jgi:MYXO-CTERM domain-containing protein
VQCNANPDCHLPDAPICNGTTHTCGSSCSKSSECPGSAPVCNPQSSQCVQCLGDGDCPAATPVCDQGSHTCVNPENFSLEGGGCACKATPSDRAETLPVLLGLGIVVTAFARRRRR